MSLLRRATAAVTAAAVSLAIPAASPARAADLPEAIRQAGTFHLSINSTYAPMEFHDPATDELKGLDIDLAEAIAKRLGVGIAWTDVPFDQLIPSLQTGRTDFIVASFSLRWALDQEPWRRRPSPPSIKPRRPPGWARRPSR